MDWRRGCAGVIPCLNEEAAIGQQVEAVRRQLTTVIVVDDGSSDRTASEARAAGAIVLRQPETSGKGAALKAGWSRALQEGFRWALSMDGDGQHAPGDIPKFFTCAEATSAALVVGNRMQEPGPMPWGRHWVNRAMSWQLSRLTGRRLPDSQCGFRLMNLQDWARLPIGVAHFEIESEVLFHFARAGLRIEFVPIQVIYKQEQSKIHPWRDTVRWLNWRRKASRKSVES
ncbi:MAG TPA: glycosyltransferase family 2 protein [Patescibacteria group bacterium]|nr:glycosyltransferase family 2 protein [Patescibacteria group bacterium]